MFKLETLRHSNVLYSHYKYLDLNLADCIIPAYLKNRLSAKLAEGNLQNMFLTGWHPEIKSTITNALAKSIDGQTLVLIFNKESQVKASQRGITTLFEFEKILNHYKSLGERKIFIISSLGNFPDVKYTQLASLIQQETFHKFIFYFNDKKLNQFLKWPVISTNFDINHSLKESEIYWDQCTNFLKKFNLSLTRTEMLEITQGKHEHWLALSGQNINKSLLRRLNFITVIPTKIKTGEQKGQLTREVQI